jgi:2',3'-cyclic-nucleotide 2'-phosphodiesterase (5'-nucleotidase family)
LSPNKNSIFRAKQGWFSILATILVVASFLGIPGNLTGHTGETEELHFCILHTNDMHSELIPHSPTVDYRPGEENPAIGGIARLAAAVKEIREHKTEEGEPVLLFDGGDFLGGGAFAWLALNGCAAELTIMQEMGYDAVTIGNHEYDYGADVLAQYLLLAGYPAAHQRTLVLASNTEVPLEHPLRSENLYKQTGIFELENGLKVGVFGLIGKDAIQLLTGTGQVQFLDQCDTARQMVDELEKQGADVIVCLSHSGVIEDRELSRVVQGIDVIVGGHCHTALHEPVLEGSTIIVQAGSLGEYLGQLDLVYDSSTDKVRVCNEENEHPFLIPVDSSFLSEPEIDALVQEYTLILNAHVAEVTSGEFDDIISTVARADFVLTNQPLLSETPLGNFVTDAMRMVAQEVTGKKVDVASLANGCIRTDILPGTMEYSAGNISFYEIAHATSVGHGSDRYAGCPVVSAYLTGEEVRRLLEITILAQRLVGDAAFIHFSGLRYSYNPSNAVLLTIPFINVPIPTTRAVTRAELYIGDGIQPVNSEEYIPLKRGDENLYQVVTDGYILSLSPLIKERLPQLEIVPKNADREPVPPERFDELIVHQADGTELKIWEAVVIYAAAQMPGLDGIPLIPDYYEGVAGRITITWTFPLVGWLILILAAIVAGIVVLILRRRKYKRAVT